MKTNIVYLVIDESGSMSSISRETEDLVKNTIKTLKEESVKNRQATYLTVIKFSYNYNVKKVIEKQNVKSIKLENVSKILKFNPGGYTALFDSVGEAINDGLVSDKGYEDLSYLVIAITDGEENDSIKYNASKLSTLIRKAQGYKNWTITFQVPSGGKVNLKRLGIESDNIREWANTKEGTKEAEQKTREGLTRFYSSRAMGQSAVNNFYVETNLKNVSVKDLKKNLTDLSDRYGIFSVSNDIAIRDFVESKGLPFYKGESFYQLTKTEVIQENKEILIFDKGKTTIYGGEEARNIIGLPLYDSAKVVPGDHANYEIFVQSTSVNRKLKEGTKVAILIH